MNFNYWVPASELPKNVLQPLSPESSLDSLNDKEFPLTYILEQSTVEDFISEQAIYLFTLWHQPWMLFMSCNLNSIFVLEN